MVQPCAGPAEGSANSPSISASNLFNDSHAWITAAAESPPPQSSRWLSYSFDREHPSGSLFNKRQVNACILHCYLQKRVKRLILQH